ncbi:hypothetical protein D7X32_11185 [Corallococcus carmarthensis]|uniref:Uncharacterized protein n=1 Tax=Corallococcus carmarthensis TaxID=2316728 RepID=A0A3A8KA52_9BACT|nr:hypothetical protein D7X32_11185 [Corallococcus carmarthensis]
MVFHAHVGLLDDEDFAPGEDVFGRTTNKRRPVYGPKYELRDGSFWAYGVGKCSCCRTEFWGKVVVRGGRFDSVALVSPPENSLDWGEL